MRAYRIRSRPFLRRRSFILSKRPAQTVAIGRVTETESSRVLTHVIQRVIGRVTETESARSLTEAELHPITRVTETETSRALAARRAKGIGRVTETESARSLVEAELHPVSRVTETESSRALTYYKRRAINRVTENETSRALTHAKQQDIGRVTEAESARGLILTKIRVIGRVTESEQSRALTEAELHPVGRVVETESARVLAHTKQQDIGRVVENESARGLTEAEYHLISRVTELETARALVHTKRQDIGRVTELEQSRSIASGAAIAIGRVTETETAGALTESEHHAIARVSEAETARGLAHARVHDVGRVTEQESARALTEAKARVAGRVTESENAGALAHARVRAIGRAIELEQSRALTAVLAGAQAVTIGRVVENESSRHITGSVTPTTTHDHGTGGTQQQQTFFLQAARRAELRARAARRRKRQRCEHRHLYFEECEPHPLPVAYKITPPLVIPDAGQPVYIEPIIRIPARVPRTGVPSSVRKALYLFKSEQEEQGILRDFYLDDAMLEESLERSILGSFNLPSATKDKASIAQSWDLTIDEQAAAIAGKISKLAKLKYDGNTAQARNLIGNLDHAAETEELFDHIVSLGYQEWQWKTVNDDVVDEDCAELSGQVFSIDEPFELAHPNCRCFPSPYGDVLEEGEDVDISRIDGIEKLPDSSRKEVAKITQEFANRYPKAFDKIDNIKLKSMSGTTYAEMDWNAGRATLQLNSNLWNDTPALRKLLAHDVEVGWHPKGTGDIAGIINHELGHVVNNAIRLEPKTGFSSTPWLDIFVADEMKSFSRYSLDNLSEAFAEVFSYLMTGPTAAQIARQPAYVQKLVAVISKFEELQ